METGEKTKRKTKKIDESMVAIPESALEGLPEYYITDSNRSLLNACIETNSAALLIGETGTGKTTVVREMAKEKGKVLIRISVNGSMGVEEILGKWLVNAGTTVWQDGILTMALREGHWVVMDEINAALPEILFVLHSLLDDDRKIFLPEKDNEIVYPHADFRFFATMNPPEEYAGTKDMNKALLSRFTAVLNVDVLDPISEGTLLQQKGADVKTASILLHIAGALREKKKKDMIFYFCSTRDLVQCVNLMGHGLKIGDAVKGSIVNKMTAKEFEIVKREFDSILLSPSLPPFASFGDIIKEIEKLKGEVAGMEAGYLQKIEEEKAKMKETYGREISDKARIEILEKLKALAEK